MIVYSVCNKTLVSNLRVFESYEVNITIGKRDLENPDFKDELFRKVVKAIEGVR